jgi:hypothetical protein
MTPNKLIVSSDDRRVAHTLLTQMYGGSVAQSGAGLGYWGSTAPTSLDGATANINIVNPKNGGVAAWDIMVSRYLDTGRWFLQAPEHELQLMWKRAPKQESWFDKKTHNTIYQTRMRYSVFAEDYRGIYGNPYTS